MAVKAVPADELDALMDEFLETTSYVGKVRPWRDVPETDDDDEDEPDEPDEEPDRPKTLSMLIEQLRSFLLEWDEGQHPRDEGGKFAEGASSVPATAGVVRPGQTFDIRQQNRRFLYNPDTDTLVLGAQDQIKAGDQEGSHAGALDDAIPGLPGRAYDSYTMRGWLMRGRDGKGHVEVGEHHGEDKAEKFEEMGRFLERLVRQGGVTGETLVEDGDISRRLRNHPAHAYLVKLSVRDASFVYALGDVPGHDFHGNQYTGGGGGDTQSGTQTEKSDAGTGSGGGDAVSSATRAAQGRPDANPEAHTVANTYNDQHGLPPVEHGYVKVDEARAGAIADAYDALPDDDRDNPKVREAYAALADEVSQQWDHIVASGVTFEPWTKDGQPYKDSKEMAADVRDSKHMYFFTGGNEHPLLGGKDPKTGLSINDKFRAVHDYFGHAAGGYGFGPRGEENAWMSHSQMLSPSARRALTTETRGQNSWVNFGDQNYHADGTPKNIPPAERPFAKQKVALLPDEYVLMPGETALPEQPKTLSYRERLVLLEWDESQHPRDDSGKFAESSLSPTGGDELSSSHAAPVGVPFRVFRIGSADGKTLEGRNAGNADALDDIYMGSLDDDSYPLGNTLHVYEVVLDAPTTGYQRFNKGEASELEPGTKVEEGHVGRHKRGEELIYSFPKGGKWTAKLIASVKTEKIFRQYGKREERVAVLRERIAALTKPPAPPVAADAVSLAADLLDDGAYGHVLDLGDVPGHKFHGNQWTEEGFTEKLSKLKLDPNRDSPVNFDFASQAEQFPAKGKPGLRMKKVVIPGKRHALGGGKYSTEQDSPINILTFRDEKGVLRGVAYHYPKGVPLYERPGNLNVMVDPKAQRQGIATRLVKEADKRWNIDFSGQDFTTEGRQFVEGLAKAGKKAQPKGPKGKRHDLGGPGSGNFGHAGRPGEVGGSGTGDGEGRWEKAEGGKEYWVGPGKPPPDPRIFKGNEGFDWHEQGPVAEWAEKVSYKDSKTIGDYAAFSYGEINGHLRGTNRPKDEEQYAKEYEEKADRINEVIRERGYELPEPLSVNRAAYIPGLSHEDLEAMVGGVMEEKGFTSTMLGNPHNRLDSYVTMGKAESIYNRTGGKKVEMDEVGTAMRIEIVLPKGTKVIPVEPVRRMQYDFPQVPIPEPRPPDIEEQHWKQSDYTATPKANPKGLQDKGGRREAEILLGSGARFRVVSVTKAAPIRSSDGSMKPVDVADVKLAYIGGGSSEGTPE